MSIPTSVVQIRGHLHPEFEQILTPEALAFIGVLDATFTARRLELLTERRERANRITAGEDLDFADGSAHVRALGTWKVAAPAPGLTDRRCEITAPPTRAMAIAALNSGAQVWLADFEDGTAPTWFNVIDGQLNVRRAIHRRIDFVDAQGQEHKLGQQLPTIMIRPRGWHLVEKHLTVDGRALSASLVDFGLAFFSHARDLINSGTGPYFYLPKLESAAEARLWNDIFIKAQELLDIPQGTIRATVLIETVTAAYEMDEILYELRRHSAGLNAGRWDYIFSYLRTYANRADSPVLPDRNSISTAAPFLRAYTDLLLATCHRRGAHAIGGLSAVVPADASSTLGRTALAKVKADKEREATTGFDGSWVAHPALVPTCLAAFGSQPNQLDRQIPTITVTASDLTDVRGVTGSVTVQGVRTNIAVSLRYLVSWLSGIGAVPIDGFMEDAATVEISRIQIWQWISRNVRTLDGPMVTRELVQRILAEEGHRLTCEIEDISEDQVAAAKGIFVRVAMDEECLAFFTPHAYAQYLVRQSAASEPVGSQEDHSRSAA